MEEYEELDMVNIENTNNANGVVMCFPFLLFDSFIPLNIKLFVVLTNAIWSKLPNQTKRQYFGTPIPNQIGIWFHKNDFRE